MREIRRDSFRKGKKTSIRNIKSYLKEFMVESTVKYRKLFSVT